MPIATFNSTENIIDVARKSWNGQQFALFTTQNFGDSRTILDALSNIVGRINLNSQCARSPDVIPFSGRRSSAMGTMSISESIRSFSVEVVVGRTHFTADAALVTFQTQQLDNIQVHKFARACAKS